MAITSAGGAIDDGNSATRSVTIPIGALANDLALLFLDRGANETATTPAGWTLVGTQSASSLTSTVWRKKLVSGDAGSNVTVTNVTAGKGDLTLVNYRGVDPNSLIEVSVSSQSTASSTTRVTPAATTATDQDWIVEHVADKSSAAGTAWTLPGGRTVRQQFYETGSGAITTVTADSNTGVSPGSQGGLTYTETAPGTQAVMWTIAIKPAPTGPSAPTNIAKTNSSTSQLTLQLTTTASASIGDLLVGSVGFDADHISLPTLNVTDDSGNVYTVGATDNNGASEGLAIFATTVTVALPSGSHILLTVDNARHRWACSVDKYTGVVSPGIGQAATNDGTVASTAVSTGTTPTLTQSGELAVMAVAWNSQAVGETFTPAAGWTAVSTTATSTGANDINVAAAWQIFPTTAAITGAGVLSAADTYEAGVVTFRSTAGGNRPPTAVAGGDIVVSPGTVVTLDGTASTDLDGTITGYAWTQTGGTTVALSSASSPTATFTAPAAVGSTTLTFQLTVTDNLAATGTDSIAVAVTQSSTVLHRESGAWVGKPLEERLAGMWRASETVTLVNAFPNPDCETGGTAFGTSLTTVTLGDLTWSVTGAGSAKVVVGGSPTTNTFGYQPVGSDSDPVSNTHGRFAAVPGDTFDFIFTVRADPANTASVNILPKLAGYHFNGTTTVASTSGDANGTAVLLNPGDVVAVAQRITVATPPSDPLDGILAIPHIRSGANVANAPVAGSIIYLDRMMLVRNSPNPLASAAWFDGDTPGASWWGPTGASSSSNVGTVTTHPPYFGTLVTGSATAAAESTGGVKVAMLELNWSSYETADGVYSASYITTVKAQLAALQNAGMQVTLAMGVHHPPAWALALTNSTQLDQTGATTTQIDTIFNKAIRTKVEAYYTQIDVDLGIHNFWAIRLTSGGNAEMLHPGGNSYWAFGPNAQNGANMPTTMDPNPSPGWHPGDTTTLTTAQVRAWATWYVDALVDVTDWQMQFFLGLGFRGYFQTLTPGSGRRPSVFTSDVNAFLPNSTTGVGAVWDIYYGNLRDRSNVIAYVSSVADGSGTVPDDASQPGDDALAITSTSMNSWSATRWQTRVAHQYGMLVGGENPGFTTSGAAHYGDTTTAGLMAKSMAQVAGCGLFVFYWAHDDRLYDGSQTFANYAAAISAQIGTTHPVPPFPT